MLNTAQHPDDDDALSVTGLLLRYCHLPVILKEY